MNRTREIEHSTEHFCQNFNHNHYLFELIRELQHKKYHLRDRFTRHQQKEVNKMFSSIKYKLIHFIDLDTDQEVQITIDWLTDNVKY